MAPFQADDNVVFLYHCLQNAAGKIDWNAVAIATGSTRGAVEMRWRRLKKKIEGDTNTGQPATPTPVQPSQGLKTSPRKRQNTGTRKRKMEASDYEDDADGTGPPQVDGQVDPKPSAPLSRTRGRKSKYDIKACLANDEDSSDIKSSESDEDYVTSAKAIKSEDDDLFMFDSGDDLKPKAKRNKTSPPLLPKVQLRQADARAGRLHIGNLPFGTTESDLRRFFKGFNVESVATFTKPRNTRETGYALVDLKSSEDAEEAVRSLSPMQLRGRKVTIGVDRNYTPRATTKPPNAHNQLQTAIEKAAPPSNANNVQQKPPAVPKAKAKSCMHPSDRPLPSIEYSPPATPLSSAFTSEKQGVVDAESEITLRILKPGMVLTLPPKSRPQVLDNTADWPVSKQDLPFSLISVTPSVSMMSRSTTTDSIGKMLQQDLADHVEIRPEDSISNIAVRPEQDSNPATVTPTGIMTNTVRFFKGLLASQT
ncbi:uncharacterized protein PV07_00714 [Cladophialophora immunda]|uniref:RRM domain-containing protein n=1 Tax=Cladophialophora immunda TaxID=569365 RepID=A0A0D2DDY8_9EURO|nr:uncharacterized protein PV07_00714 [Cladophialophora immunda]KIW33899.1 hypothetical protein PV07_00714 [Cladophialophora immunda]